MKEEYDFSGARRNPYAKKLKKQITINLDSDVIDRALRYISKADVLIIGGTSLTVYPAAGFVSYYRGSRLVLINKSATPMDNRADLVINQPIGQVMSMFL